VSFCFLNSQSRNKVRIQVIMSNSALFIKLGEVTSNIFVDDCLSIPMFLVDDADKLNSPPEQFNKVTVQCRVELAAGAVNAEDTKCQLADPVFAPAFDVEPDSCIIRSNGTGTLRLTFRQVSMNFENRKFVLCVSMKNNAREVVAAQTKPLFVISQQLVLNEDYSSTYTWYKDEGGKDKCIEYAVHMVDRVGSKVKGKKVALKVTLMYKNGQQVPQQNILTVLPDSKLVLDERSGSALIRVRINEVSTRHQGQFFQVLVSPDIAVGPSTADVCPVLSVAVDVKSKRNHHKERDRDRVAAESRMIPLSTIQQRFNSGNSENNFSEHPNKRLRQTSDDSVVSSVNDEPLRSVVRLADHQCIHEDGVVIDNCMCKSHGHHLRYSEKPVDFSGAVGNLVLWAKTVMKGMENIQWKQVGYATGPDGNPDITKPLFSIPNPHEAITDIVQEYSDYIQPSLHFLGGMVDDTHGHDEHDHHHMHKNSDAHMYDDKFLNLLSCMDSWAHDNVVDGQCLR
jgi:hypothetical protein